MAGSLSLEIYGYIWLLYYIELKYYVLQFY